MKNIKEQVISDLIKFAKKQALALNHKTAFVDVFNDKSLAKLKNYAKLYKIPKYTKLTKEELIECLYNHFIDKQFLEEFLFLLNQDDFKMLLQLKKPTVCDANSCANMEFLHYIGFVHTYYENDEFVAVVPTELVTKIELIATDVFIKAKERSDLINSYAVASVNLYGYITIKEFIAIFNKLSGKNTNFSEIYDYLSPHALVETDYVFYKDCIVSSKLSEDFQKVDNLMIISQNKSHYIPSKAEFLEYSDSFYVEFNEHCENLQKYMIENYDNAILASEICYELCLGCSREMDINQLLTVLRESNLTINDKKNEHLILELLNKVKNNSRLWIHKGHTPLEIHKMKEDNHFGNLLKAQKNVPIKTVKTGRNDPCTCGSGKKYKKCCGKA